MKLFERDFIAMKKALIKQTFHFLFFFATNAGLPSFDREPQDTMVYPGQIAYLSCKLATEDRVEVQWIKDEQPISLDESRMTVLPSGEFRSFVHYVKNSECFDNDRKNY